MNKAEREKLLRENAESRDAIQRDLDARRQRRLRGEEPFDDDPPRTVPNQGELQVRESFERGRPKLDDATQARWNAWLDHRCSEIIDGRIDAVADILGEESGALERQLREDIRAMRGSIFHELRDTLIQKFGDEYFSVMRDGVLEVLRKEIGIADGTVVDLPNPLRKA